MTQGQHQLQPPSGGQQNMDDASLRSARDVQHSIWSRSAGSAFLGIGHSHGVSAADSIPSPASRPIGTTALRLLPPDSAQLHRVASAVTVESGVNPSGFFLHPNPLPQMRETRYALHASACGTCLVPVIERYQNGGTDINIVDRED
jgi:hypothetical protein